MASGCGGDAAGADPGRDLFGGHLVEALQVGADVAAVGALLGREVSDRDSSSVERPIDAAALHALAAEFARAHACGVRRQGREL